MFVLYRIVEYYLLLKISSRPETEFPQRPEYTIEPFLTEEAVDVLYLIFLDLTARISGFQNLTDN